MALYVHEIHRYIRERKGVRIYMYVHLSISPRGETDTGEGGGTERDAGKVLGGMGKETEGAVRGGGK